MITTNGLKDEKVHVNLHSYFNCNIFYCNIFFRYQSINEMLRWQKGNVLHLWRPQGCNKFIQSFCLSQMKWLDGLPACQSIFLYLKTEFSVLKCDKQEYKWFTFTLIMFGSCVLYSWLWRGVLRKMSWIFITFSCILSKSIYFLTISLTHINYRMVLWSSISKIYWRWSICSHESNACMYRKTPYSRTDKVFLSQSEKLWKAYICFYYLLLFNLGIIVT